MEKWLIQNLKFPVKLWHFSWEYWEAILYIIRITSNFGKYCDIFRHYWRDWHYFWLIFPSIGSHIAILSSTQLWPMNNINQHYTMTSDLGSISPDVLMRIFSCLFLRFCRDPFCSTKIAQNEILTCQLIENILMNTFAEILPWRFDVLLCHLLIINLRFQKELPFHAVCNKQVVNN